MDPPTLQKEKRDKYRGSFKIALQNLRPEQEGINTRQTDPKNVSRLVRIYEIEGCDRFETQNHVPVLVGEENAGLVPPSDGNMQPPEFLHLEQSTRLVYLHGHHRLQAARVHLPPADAWWIADLYAEDISDEIKSVIREEYSGTSNFCDGDIYRHLRRCTLDNDPKARKWLARLTYSKRRDVLQLHKAADKDGQMRQFRDSLDALLPFPGLWPALHLGAFHRLLTFHCPEELAHYLTRVRSTWDDVCGYDGALTTQVDAYTVESLEGRCLYYSRDDSAVVELAMSQRKIFPSITSQSTRSNILARLRAIKYPIPSLHTFLEDTKYIEPCVQVMKGILPHPARGTIRQRFAQLHNGQDRFYEQTTEMHERQTREPPATVEWKSYRQIWLFAFRHFPEMTGFPPRKDPGRPRPISPSIEHTWWHKLASLAELSGYRNINRKYPEIEDADTRMTQRFLHQVRPSEYYCFDDGVFDAEVRRICSTLCKARARPIEPERPALASDRETGCSGDSSSRCGRPFETTFLADRPLMFLQYCYSRELENVPRRFLTTFAVKRSTFHHFFGGMEQYRRMCPTAVEGEDNAPTSPVPPSLDPTWDTASGPGSDELQNASHRSILEGQPARESRRLTAGLDQPIRESRSPTTGVVVVRPLDPIHDGIFESDFVRWDQPDLLRTTLGLGSGNSILLAFDRSGHLKSIPAADIVQTGSSYQVIFRVRENEVGEVSDRYDKLTQQTIQDIYLGLTKSIA